MAILMNNDQSDALNASLTAQIRSLYAADPSLLTSILANPLSDAAWNAVNLGEAPAPGRRSMPSTRWIGPLGIR